MKIIILGASGKTGSLLVKQALDASYIVTAFVRDPLKLKFRHKNLIVAKGNAYEVKTLAFAMKGQEAVLNTLGTNSMKESSEFTKITTQNVIEAMNSNGVKRIVMMSTFAVVNNQLSSSTKLVTSMLMKKALYDKTLSEQLLIDNNLAWTIVYATRLTNDNLSKKTRIVKEDERLGLRNSISRADVAYFMLRSLKDPKTVGKRLIITDK